MKFRLTGILFILFIILINYLKFLKQITKKNGLISSIPYIASLVSINLSSVLSDHMLKSNKISRSNVRRIFISLGKTNF